MPRPPDPPLFRTGSHVRRSARSAADASTQTPRRSAPDVDSCRIRMAEQSIREQFTAAVDALVEQVKEDRSVLAAILCGSLSHDTVWAKSDIDLVLVTTDDKKPNREDVALDANGVNVHACLLPRAEFRKLLEGAVRNSFMHSFL